MLSFLLEDVQHTDDLLLGLHKAFGDCTLSQQWARVIKHVRKPEPDLTDGQRESPLSVQFIKTWVLALSFTAEPVGGLMVSLRVNSGQALKQDQWRISLYQVVYVGEVMDEGNQLSKDLLPLAKGCDSSYLTHPSPLTPEVSERPFWIVCVTFSAELWAEQGLWEPWWEGCGEIRTMAQCSWILSCSFLKLHFLMAWDDRLFLYLFGVWTPNIEKEIPLVLLASEFRQIDDQWLSVNLSTSETHWTM